VSRFPGGSTNGIMYFSMFDIDRNASIPGPTWLRKQLGDNYFCTIEQAVIHLNDREAAKAAIDKVAVLPAIKCLQLRAAKGVGKIEDSDLLPLGQLGRLDRLWLVETHINGKFLAELRNPACMTQLSLENNDIDDSALAQIGKMTNLENLVLRGNARITDAGLSQLRNLAKLQVLTLESTSVTDAGLSQLAGLDRLRYLNLSNTQVTNHGIRDLRTSLPQCRIVDSAGQWR